MPLPRRTILDRVWLTLDQGTTQIAEKLQQNFDVADAYHYAGTGQLQLSVLLTDDVMALDGRTEKITKIKGLFNIVHNEASRVMFSNLEPELQNFFFRIFNFISEVELIESDSELNASSSVLMIKYCNPGFLIQCFDENDQIKSPEIFLSEISIESVV